MQPSAAAILPRCRPALWAAVVWCCCALPAASAAELPLPAAPTQWVTDTAGFLAPPVAARINDQLRELERAAGLQVVVWIGATNGGIPIDEWAARTFEKWGVGRQGKDNGLALFILTQDRTLRIEVGYGLEGEVPDAVANRIVQQILVPGIREGNQNAAVTAAVNELVAILGQGQVAAVEGPAGASPAESPRSDTAPGIGIGQILFLGLLAVAFLILFINNPAFAMYLLVSILSNSRGGGGGGGGFSGGGGRSGGGGASGSW